MLLTTPTAYFMPCQLHSALSFDAKKGEVIMNERQSTGLISSAIYTVDRTFEHKNFRWRQKSVDIINSTQLIMQLA